MNTNLRKKIDTASTGQENNQKLKKVIGEEMEQASNGFPIEIFPDFTQNLIKDAKITKGFNKDFLSAGILSTCATAIGQTIKIDNGVWQDKPILWLAIIGNSGSGKSHALEYALRPLKNKDNEYYELYRQQLKEFEQEEDPHRSDKPKYTHYILDDFTPEKLAETLQFNKKGVNIFKDELIGWLNSFDQYRSGGDQQKYLELFNGGGITVERKTQETVKATDTNVNILGGLQPQKIKQLAGNDRKSDGFLNRILFLVPKNLRPVLFSGQSINEKLNNQYHKWINNLLEVPESQLISNLEEKNIFQKWQHENSKKYFDDAIENGIQKKLETYVWRFALIIELMEQATDCDYNATLRPQSINKAIKLAEYFRNNARRVHDQLSGINPLEDLTGNQLELYQELPSRFERKYVLEIFKKYEITGGSMARFLNDKKLFKRKKQGEYIKVGKSNTW